LKAGLPPPPLRIWATLTRAHRGNPERMKILLEGRPGAGKSTVARRLADLLLQDGKRIGGFLTEELREHGRRVGFCVEAFGGERATLAHVSLPGPPRVGRYGVDLEAFERIALAALEAAEHADVVVVDELGKMELASEAFCAAVVRLFEGRLPVVATTHVFRHPFTDDLKRRRDVERMSVTSKTRDSLPSELAALCEGTAKKSL
jgi:nucleoside-triphosphatase